MTPEKPLEQIKEFQELIHYAPEKKREYLRQVQMQDRVGKEG
jgi:hypothetical protein